MEWAAEEQAAGNITFAVKLAAEGARSAADGARSGAGLLRAHADDSAGRHGTALL